MKNFTKLIMTVTVLLATVISVMACPLTVNTFDSQGNPISGKYKVWKGPNYVGEYASGTQISLESGKSYTVFAHYQNSQTEKVTFTAVSAGHVYNFYTTNIKFHWCGDYLDYGSPSGGFTSFGKTNGEWNALELFPKSWGNGNPMTFHIAYKWNDTRKMNFQLNYQGIAKVEKVLSQLQLKDHNGNPLEGGKARGGYGTPTVWHVAGETNAQGLLLDMRDGSNNNLSYEMRYNNTNSWSAQQISCIYEFQTQLITVRMETCEGDPVNDGVAAYGIGTNTGTWFFPGGKTGTSAPGETEAEFFPGTYSFRMQYKATTDYVSSFDFPTDGEKVIFKTTSVTINYNGQLAYGGSTGDSKFFEKPTMELLPGTYVFNFRSDGVRKSITIGGCETTKSAFGIKLLDSNGDGLEGGIGSYYLSGWKSAGTTDTDGNIFVLLDEDVTKLSVRMKWAGYTQQQSNVDITTTNPVIFQTIPMVARLEDSGGNGLADGVASYYASGWKSLGTTAADGNTPALELLPGKYSFRMKYLGYSLQKSNIIIPDTNPVVFATTPMVVELRNSADALIDEGVVTYYASGWKNFGTTSGGTVSKELLPGNYSFRMKYEGFSQQKSGVKVDDDSPLVFKTELMEVQLKNSTGSLMDEGVVTYYASGWKSFGTTSGGTVSKELLPGSYSFRMLYEGYSQQQSSVDITSVNPLIFQTIAMVVSLQTCDPTGLPGGDVTYYASGWKTFGTTDVNGNSEKELLPGKYSFRMKYLGQSNQESNVDITTTNPLVYNTTKVTLNYGGNITYYASGWKPFTKPTMEMLPNNYSFRFDKNQTKLDIQGCDFELGATTIKLVDSNGDGIEGALAKYNVGGWQIAGTTDSNGEVFTFINSSSSNIKFRIEYGGLANEKYQDISVSPEVVFNTTLVTMKLLTEDNSTELAAVSKYNGGGWKTFGSGTTTTTMELLPNNVKFRVEYGGLANEKYQDISVDPVVIFNTKQVTMKLLASDNSTELAAVSKYNGAGWKTFGTGTTTTTMELLPNNVKFRVEYGGLANEKYQDISSNPIVVFNTTMVTMKLLASDNTTELAGTTKYNGAGWKSFGSGTSTTTMELLPNNVKFRIEYGGLANEKYQDISVNPVVIFNTTLVTMKLLNGTTELAGTSKYNGGGWKTFGSGTTTTTMELLPNNVKFRLEYSGTAKEKYQDIGVDALVIFDWDGASLKSGLIGETADNVTPDFSYKLYPVPANIKLNVEVTFETNVEAEYHIMDMSGRKMENGIWKLKKGINTNEISLDNFVSGQYIFIMRTSEKVITEKFSVFK